MVTLIVGTTVNEHYVGIAGSSRIKQLIQRLYRHYFDLQCRTGRLVHLKFLSKLAGTIVGALKERIRYRGKSSGAINNHVPE